MAPVTVTYYLEILSSWCHWAEPTWSELKTHYAGRVDFRWRIALMRPEDFPASAGHCDWFYQRSGTLMRSSYMLSSGWVDPALQGHYEAPNWVAEAGREFTGAEDDRIRLALSDAGLRHGRRIGDMDTAVSVAAEVAGVDARLIHAAAQSDAVRARVDASTAAFHAHQVTQRPTFVVEDQIGDKAVFSGLVQLAPLTATIDAMLADCAGYAAYKAHFGSPPH